MSRKNITIAIGVALATAGFILCLMAFQAAFSINKDGPPWYGRVGWGLLGFSFAAFVLAAFTDD